MRYSVDSVQVLLNDTNVRFHVGDSEFVLADLVLVARLFSFHLGQHLLELLIFSSLYRHFVCVVVGLSLQYRHELREILIIERF